MPFNLHCRGIPVKPTFLLAYWLTILNREMNDRDFDVALCVVFERKADHDAYQVADCHLEYIEANKDNWAQVRVFDFYHA